MISFVYAVLRQSGRTLKPLKKGIPQHYVCEKFSIPIMVDNIKFKFPAISAVMSRIGDLLNNQMFNIFQMLRVGTEEPASQTLTSESASDAYQQRKTTGTDFLRSMSVPGRIEEAKAEIANMLDSKNPESLEWINVRNLFGERAEAVRTALLSGKFGFGSPGEQDGCA